MEKACFHRVRRHDYLSPTFGGNMKAFITSLVLFFAWHVGAVETTSTTYSQSPTYTMEPSFTFSSINGGSRFVSAALTSRLTSWLRVGVEGEVPADFNEQAQIYSGRLLARVPLLDREHKIFLQGAVSASFYNGEPEVLDGATVGAEAFFNGSMMLGYSKRINSSWALGALLGAQYSTIQSYVFNRSTEGLSLYNRLSLTGSYTF